MNILPFLVKWLHLLSIIGVLGSIATAWFVLTPAARGGAEGEDDTSGTIWRRFGMAQGALWLVVLLTGFYNYFTIGPSATGTYHMFAGMKIALALLMFVLSMALAHPIPALEGLRRARPMGLMVLVVLGIIVVGISANLNLGRISGQYIKKQVPAASGPFATPGVGSTSP